MPIDIQGAIDDIVSDDYPTYTIKIGNAAFVAYIPIPPGLSAAEINTIKAQNQTNGWYDDDEFYEVHIDDKSNTIPTAKLTFVNKTEDDLQDQYIRIYLDGIKKFSGVIKKCSDSYRSNEVTVDCLGIAYELQRLNIKKITDHQGVKSSDIIYKELNPADPENINDDSWIYDSSDTSAIGWRVDIDTSGNNFILNYRIETGNFLQHIANICIENYWEWWVEEPDRVGSVYLKILKIASHRGLESPSVTFTLEESAYDAIIDKDKDKLKNAVLVSGSSSQVSNTATTAAGFFSKGDDTTPSAMGFVIGSESVLAEPVAIGDTSLVLVNASGYDTPGSYTVKIDDEEFTYTAVDTSTNTLTVGAATAAHEPGSAVLMISLMRAFVPTSVTNASKKVWIGNELIQYGSLDYWGLHDLIRGVQYNGNSTPVYPHGDGTKIFNGENSLSAPASSSSIGSYGQVDSRISAIGPIDRDGLDKYGTSVLLTSQNYEQFGSFLISLDVLSSLVIGDAFYLKEYGTGEQTIRRCMGLMFSGDVIMITFGLNEDYILNQFDSVNQIDNRTYVSQDMDASHEAVEISSDETAVKYEKPDGTYEWVPIR